MQRDEVGKVIFAEALGGQSVGGEVVHGIGLQPIEDAPDSYVSANISRSVSADLIS